MRFVVISRVLLFLLCCTAVLIATSALPFARAGETSMLLLGLISCAGAFLVTWLFSRWSSIPLASSGASIDRGSAARLLAGLVVGLAIFAAQWAFMWALGHVHWEYSPAISTRSAATMVAAFLLLSGREELAFRGFALRQLHAHFGLWRAQISIAILFALEHVAGGSSLANAFAGAGMGSLLFGMAAVATRGLAVPVGIHAAWNIGDWLRGGWNRPARLKMIPI